MKIYAIRDNTIDKEKDLAYFFYYERTGECCIEINEGVSQWELPFVLEHFARKGMLSVDEAHTRTFIMQRVIPPDRQNIGMVLKDNGLDEYDEIKLFILADGRCCQDDCYIKAISYDRLPQNIITRLNRRIEAVQKVGNGDWLISFADGKIGLINIAKMIEHSRIEERLWAYVNGLEEVNIKGAGSSIALLEKKHISWSELYQNCSFLPISLTDLYHLSEKCFITTQEVCKMLDCSRQNVSDLVTRGKLHPIGRNSNGNIFDKAEVNNIL